MFLVLAALVAGALLAFGTMWLLLGGDEEEAAPATRDASHACLLARSIPADADDELFADGDDGMVAHSRFVTLAELAAAASVADPTYSTLEGHGEEAVTTYARTFSLEEASGSMDALRAECDRLEL